MAEDRRDVGLLAITSADRLHAGWECGSTRAGTWADPCPVAYRMAAGRRAVPIAGVVTVIDGHPATLGWLGVRPRPPHPRAGCRAFRPDRHRSPTSTATSASMRRGSYWRDRRRRRESRSGISTRSADADRQARKAAGRRRPASSSGVKQDASGVNQATGGAVSCADSNIKRLQDEIKGLRAFCILNSARIFMR